MKGMLSWNKVALGLLLAAYLALGVLYAFFTPIWQVPDEPAHYNYVKYVAENRNLPVLQVGDYPAAYLEELKSRRFPTAMSVEPLRYEFWQPPLYYSVAAFLYGFIRSWPLASQVVALRLFSVLLGGGILLIAYCAAREVFPHDFALALGTAAFVAAVPMHVAITAAVSNDALAELIFSAILLGCLRLIKGAIGERKLLTLGLLVGLSLLTKGTIYISLPLVLLALYIGFRRPDSLRTAIRWPKALLFVFGPASAVSGWWFVRNMIVYGSNDPLIWRRHAEVVAGQLTTAEYIAEHGLATWLSNFVLTTFHSFWGQFGWMAVPMDQRVYLALLFFSGLVGLGLLLFIIRQRRDKQSSVLSPDQRRMLAFLGLSAVMTIVLYLWYNRQLVQFQGRYLFPAIVPLGLAFTLGLAEMLRREYGGWLAALLGGGTFLLIVKGFLTGDFDMLLLLLCAASAVGFLFRRKLPAHYNAGFMALAYGALVALSAASPFLFILPYLRPT